MDWSAYVITSEARGSTYVGIALDVERRVAEHNGLAPGGARLRGAERLCWGGLESSAG